MLITNHGAKIFAYSFNSWTSIIEFKWDKIFLVYNAEASRLIDPSLVFQYNKKCYGINYNIQCLTSLYTYLMKPYAYTRICRLFPLTAQLTTELYDSDFVDHCDTIEELIELVGRYSTLEVL